MPTYELCGSKNTYDVSLVVPHTSDMGYDLILTDCCFTQLTGVEVCTARAKTLILNKVVQTLRIRTLKDV